jgi:hypothetical protein
MAQLPLMRCFTDAELRRGLAAVIDGADRCGTCSIHRRVHHRGVTAGHVFVQADVLDVFLKGARLDDREIPDGESDPAR